MFHNIIFAAGGLTEITERFGLDWPHFIAQCLSFLIVAAALTKWAYRPIVNTLEARKQRIAEGLTNAEKIKVELARTEAQRQEVMAQVNAQATKLIEEARAAAARLQAQETQKAIAAAEQIMVKAREASAQDYLRMLAELKREVGRLVVQTTAAVTGKVLTPEDQRRLSEETSKVVVA
jgi:F-type H+-transporting ATPase subunit b